MELELADTAGYNVKMAYSKSMWENLIKHPVEIISLVDCACSNIAADSLSNEVKLFRLFAKDSGYTEEAIQNIACSVWGLDNYEYSDCIDDQE